MIKRLLFLISFLTLVGFGEALAQDAEVTTEPPQAIRLFIQQGSDKAYLVGHNWLTLTFSRKIALVDSARRAALKLGSVMALPAEVYIRELDLMYTQNPALRHVEVGQAIQGIAISMKDWDSGKGSLES